MQNQNINDTAEEMPEMQQLDSIISKVQAMKQSGNVDVDEILMDLEDFKAVCNGEDMGEVEPSSPSDMSGMIDKMSMGGGK